MSQPKIVALTSKMAGKCLSCEEMIYIGQTIWWCPGVGAWHSECKKPLNLQTYWNEKSK